MNYYNKIKVYLENGLNPNEKAAFEQAMAEDPNLTEAVENFELVEPLLDYLVEEDIRQEVLKQSHVERPKITVWIKWAAVVAGVVAAGIWVLMVQGQPDPLELYAQYYQPYIPDQTRGGQSSDAITTETALYQRAHQMLKENRLEEAALIFKKLQDSQDKQIKEQAQWMEIMTALKSEDINKAESVLQILLQNPEHIYQEKAQRLQKSLSR